MVKLQTRETNGQIKRQLMRQIEKKINQKMMNSKKTEFIMCLVFRILFLV